MAKEIWKPIHGFSKYEVSNLGRVRVKTHLVKAGKAMNMLILGKILKPRIDNDGYCNITMWKRRGVHKTRFIHRLVARAFIPNPHHYPQVNHKDEDPKDNRASNLEWCTPMYNSHYGNHSEHLSESQSHPLYRVCLTKHGHSYIYPNGMAAAKSLIEKYHTHANPLTVESDICTACRDYPERIFRIYGYSAHYVSQVPKSSKSHHRRHHKYVYKPRPKKVRYVTNRHTHQRFREVTFRI